MVRTENLNVGRHVVQFYGRDDELADKVTDYLLGALDGGGVAIVIATPEHRREFETRLGQAGVDLATARDDSGSTEAGFGLPNGTISPSMMSFNRIPYLRIDIPDFDAIWRGDQLQ